METKDKTVTLEVLKKVKDNASKDITSLKEEMAKLGLSVVDGCLCVTYKEEQ